MGLTTESLSPLSPHPHITPNPSKRPVHSIHNRLESIISDSCFVTSVSTAYDLPLIANERCGSWYIQPELKVESAYFKSTDGHKDEWSFNSRRVNLHILRVVAENNGAVIVDSTRRKIMPDSMSKTIPIWCCVLNRAIFPDSPSYHHLYTPPHVVPRSEHTQIEKRIDDFVRQFLDICKPNLTHLRSQISKPLRPIWITQASDLPETRPQLADFYPLVLCTASRRVRDSEDFGNAYIQGAADDHEAWSCGLTPALFWKHQSRLLGADEQDLPSLIKEITTGEEATDAIPTRIEPTSNLYVSTTHNLDLEPYQIIISCGPAPQFPETSDYARTKKYLWLKCQNGKPGSRDLRLQLPRLITFFSSLPSQPGKILVCCSTGKDLSVGVSLAILCLYADERGRITPKLERKQEITKTFIKQRLAWLTTTNASLNPSRKTLLAVHAFLMPEPSALSTGKTGGTDAKPSTTTATSSIRTHCSSKAAQDSPSLPHPPPSTALSTIFHALRNAGKPWIFTRTLTSHLAQHPSGTVNGTATFVPFATSSSGHNQSVSSTLHAPSNTLLYSEEGEFATTTGLTLPIRKNYIYRLELEPGASEETPARIAVYFDSGEAVQEHGIGGLFVEIDAVETAAEDEGEGVLEAKNREQHLCAQDLYAASWRFDVRLAQGVGEGGQWWQVQYIVRGPHKDYTSHTMYRRT